MDDSLPQEESTDSFGLWPSKIKFPFAKYATYPPDTLRPPRGLPTLKLFNLKSMLDSKLTEKPNLLIWSFHTLKTYYF